MSEIKSRADTTAIIERHKRRETSVEETITVLYLVGISTRRSKSVSAVTVPPSTTRRSKSSRNNPANRLSFFVFIDEARLKRSRGDYFENAAVMVVMSANDDSYREAIGVAESFTKPAEY